MDMRLRRNRENDEFQTFLRVRVEGATLRVLIGTILRVLEGAKGCHLGRANSRTIG